MSITFKIDLPKYIISFVRTGSRVSVEIFDKRANQAVDSVMETPENFKIMGEILGNAK